MLGAWLVVVLCVLVETSDALGVDSLVVSRLLQHLKWDGTELCSRYPFECRCH